MTTSVVTGLIAAAVVFIILFVILGVTLWVSIVAGAGAWIIVAALGGGATRRQTAH